jgi:CheY-like chemotaxis protein
VLLGDQPHSGDKDPLGFEGIAEELAQLVLDSRSSTPFTLGVEAAWGMGKSTLLGRLCTRLEKEAEVTPVLFNAWTADDGGVLEGLVKTVLHELDPNILRRTLRNEKLLRGLRAAISVMVGLLGFGNIVDVFWDRVASDPSARNDLRKLVGDAVEAWRSSLPGVGSERLLCVFVDDLDRCSPTGVLNVFEAMKLYLDVPGIVFIIGYDEDIVSDIVLKEKGYSSEAIESRDYLEKFIQIVYRIPRAAPERSKALVTSLLESSGTGHLFGLAEREILIEESGANPRRIKRFINGFVLAYGLDPRWREFEPEALIRVQLLWMYFPRFARVLDAPGPDPVEEFLAFRRARSNLREEGELDWDQVEAVLRGYGVQAPSSPNNANFGALLSRLEENIPIPFGSLADRSEFVSLAERLESSPDWQRLRIALSEGKLPITEAREEPKAGPVAGSDEFASTEFRILWIDDEPARNEPIARRLVELGATVMPLQNTDEMQAALLQEAEFDLLISDITREGDVESGLDAVEELRKRRENLPVIFFTARITKARLESARRLAAVITNDPEDLIRRVIEIWSQRNRRDRAS